MDAASYIDHPGGEPAGHVEAVKVVGGVRLLPAGRRSPSNGSTADMVFYHIDKPSGPSETRRVAGTGNPGLPCRISIRWLGSPI